jgi:hypothetical protein
VDARRGRPTERREQHLDRNPAAEQEQADDEQSGCGRVALQDLENAVINAGYRQYDSYGGDDDLRFRHRSTFILNNVNDDLSLGVALFQVVEGVRGLLQRVNPINHWFELAGFDQLL